jgi:hypothetical protein
MLKELQSLKDLISPLMEYPLTCWLMTAAVVIQTGAIVYSSRDFLRIIPLSVRLFLLLAFTAGMTPIVVEAFHALIRNKTLPTRVEGVKCWPVVGLVAWVAFLSTTLTFLVFQLWEPWKDELLVKVPKALEYLGTGLLAGLIHSGGLASFLYIYSGREIPIFTTEHVLLIGLGQVGMGLLLALWLRTMGANRFLADLLGLALMGTVTFWIADLLGLADNELVLWMCGFSTASWAFWGVGRFVRDLIRFRRKEGGELLPVEDSPSLHVCPQCDREFVTLRGLRIHEGRMHKEPVEV